MEELPVLGLRINVVLGKEGGHGFVVSKETEVSMIETQPVSGRLNLSSTHVCFVRRLHMKLCSHGPYGPFKHIVGVIFIMSEGIFSYNKHILEPSQSMESSSKESEEVQELLLEDLFGSLKQWCKQLFKKAK